MTLVWPKTSLGRETAFLKELRSSSKSYSWSRRSKCKRWSFVIEVGTWEPFWDTDTGLIYLVGKSFKILTLSEYDKASPSKTSDLSLTDKDESFLEPIFYYPLSSTMLRTDSNWIFFCRLIVMTNKEHHCQVQQTQSTRLQRKNHILLRLPVQQTKRNYLKLHNYQRKAVRQACHVN